MELDIKNYSESFKCFLRLKKYVPQTKLDVALNELYTCTKTGKGDFKALQEKFLQERKRFFADLDKNTSETEYITYCFEDVRKMLLFNDLCFKQWYPMYCENADKRRQNESNFN